MRLYHLVHLCLSSLFLAGCVFSTATPELLPTRAATPTPTPPPITAQAYYEEGLIRQEAGDAAGALQSFNWAIELDSAFAPAYIARGSVYLAQEEFWLAMDDADSAIQADPASAAAYAFYGEALRARGRGRSALEAFDQALDLDPSLRLETFRSRWLAARAAGDADRLLVLSSEYAEAHLDDPLRHYYRAWAFTEFGTPRTSINILIRAIRSTPDPPALFWFALGHAYATEYAWPQAVTSFESVRTMVQEGDTSLTIHSDQPIPELFGVLGKAYLNADRCSDAEAMLQYAIDVGAPVSEYGPMLERAHTCLPPTPTPIPSPTPTPSQ
jgi:tetratricopeptide (TPR) repeat protein